MSSPFDSLKQAEDQDWIVSRVREEVSTGTVKCVMVQVLYDDDSSATFTSGGTMVEQVGLLESMKYDLLVATRTNRIGEDDVDDESEVGE